MDKLDTKTSVDVALQNDLILKSIFDWLDWKTVCVCRQISKQWHVNSLLRWRELAPPVILCEDDVENMAILNHLPLAHLSSEDKYRWEGINGCNNIVIQNTRLGDQDWISKFTFLRDRGHQVRRLEFATCVFINVEPLEDVMSCTYTPKLLSLKLTHSEYWFRKIIKNFNEGDVGDISITNVVKSFISFEIQYTYGNSKFPLSWVSVLSKFPNIKKIRVAEYSAAELETIFEAVEEIYGSDKTTKLIPLTSIDVGDRGYDRRLRFPLPLYELILNNKSCLQNLTCLSFAITRHVQKNQFKILLETVGSKLQHLKISGSFTGKNRSLKLPVIMPNMLCLKLDRFHIKNLNFLSKTPKLEKLYIYEMRRFVDSYNVIRRTILDKSGNEISCPSLSTFACNQVVPYKHEDIVVLKSWMPNLTTLKLHLNDSSFFAICMNFSCIKQLHICKSKVTDYGFTGYRRFDVFKDSEDENDRFGTDHSDTDYETLSDDEMPNPAEPDDSDEFDSEDSNNKTSDSDDDDNSRNSNTSSGDDEMEENATQGNENKVKFNQELYEKRMRRMDAGREPLTSSSDSSSSCSSNNEHYCEDSDDICSRKYSHDAIYQKKIKIQPYEMEPIQVPYNASLLKDLEVLVIERCVREYGRNGLVSTVPFRNTFVGMPKLREVWVENGVTTKSGQLYATARGLYRQYNTRNIFCPQFMD